MANSHFSRDFILNFIGILLIVLFFLRVFALLRGESLVNFFWLCNHAPLIMGLAILFRSSFLLSAEISLLFFGFLNWTGDYLFKMFFGINLFGATEYLFPISDLFFFSVTTSVHFLTIPLGIIALFLLKKPEPNAWKGSLIHGILLIPFVLYFGEEYNLNCFLAPCVNWFPNFNFYPVIFFLGYFALIVIPINFLIYSLVKKFQ